MATHRQLPNNMDIAPFQEKGRWYRAFIEKDESGNAKLTYADAGLPAITPTGYGFTMEGEKNGKHFHVVSVSSNPAIGKGNAGDAAFYYPTIGINYTDSGSQYVVDFNHHESKTSIALNGTDIAGTTTVNGINQTETKFDINALTDININPTLTKVDSADDEGFTATKNISNGNAIFDLALKIANSSASDSSNVLVESVTTTALLQTVNDHVNNDIFPLFIFGSVSSSTFKKSSMLLHWEYTNNAICYRYDLTQSLTSSFTNTYTDRRYRFTLLFNDSGFDLNQELVEVEYGGFTTSDGAFHYSTFNSVTEDNEGAEFVSPIVLISIKYPTA